MYLKEMQNLINMGTWLLAYACKLLRRRLTVLLLLLGILSILLKWNYMCMDIQPRRHIQTVCLSYENGKSVGSLCKDLCLPDGISSISCHTFYIEKDSVFSGIWKNNSLMFKTVKQTTHKLDKEISDYDFTTLIKNNIKSKFNMSVDIADAKRLTLVLSNQDGLTSLVEKQNAWALLQNNEYLALSLYEKYDIFPRLFGTCGSMYAVQKLNSISGYWHLMTVYDSRKEWEKRLKVSLMILDYILVLEEKLAEPLHLCEVNVNNFGVTNDFKKVMYLDLDSVHPRSVVNSLTANGKSCRHHSDCDFKDCRSFCNLVTYKCQHGVVNNNLQMVCEKIFLGWVLSGRLVVPGLLLGPHTPGVLVELLELCANPARESVTPRAAAGKEIRSRIYSLISHLFP